MTIKVKAIIGSTSSNSFNLKVVNFMKERYKEQLEITPVFVSGIEEFSVDVESDIPANAKAFKENVADSDAVLFAVPEYNYSVPGAMKNAIDWLSRGELKVLVGKPAFIVGASLGGLGTVRAQLHLKQILACPTLAPALLPGNEVYIGAVHEKMNEAGELTDQGTVDFLDTVVSNFVAFYNDVQAVKNNK